MSALMWFLTRMRATMHAQVVLRNKAFATNVANMRFLAGVLALMHREISLAGYGLAAVLCADRRTARHGSDAGAGLRAVDARG